MLRTENFSSRLQTPLSRDDVLSEGVGVSMSLMLLLSAALIPSTAESIKCFRCNGATFGGFHTTFNMSLPRLVPVLSFPDFLVYVLNLILTVSAYTPSNLNPYRIGVITIFVQFVLSRTLRISSHKLIPSGLDVLL